MKTKWFWGTFVPMFIMVVLCIWMAFVCLAQYIKIDKLEVERDNYKLLYELSDQPSNFKQ